LRQGFSGWSEAELLALLAHADQRVRLGAQFELVNRQRAEALLRVASDHHRTVLARVHGLWGYGQLMRRGEAATAGLRSLLADSVAEIRAQTAKMIGDAPGGASLSMELLPLLHDTEPRVRLQAAIAL